MPERGLTHYSAVRERGRSSNAALARSVEVEFSPEEEVWELWDKHRTGMELLEEKDRDASQPGLDTPDSSLLDLKAEIARRTLEECVLCPNRCRVDRSSRTGVCGAPEESRLSSEFLHMAEEPELVPSHTLFFGGCTMDCSYCQNHGVADLEGRFDSPGPEEIAEKVERKARNSAANVNWVGGDPTPHLYHVLGALAEMETSHPSIWNSNMYLSPEALELLEGTQDLYLADLKYGDDRCAEELSGASNYTGRVRKALVRAEEDADLLIRHLVLPGHLECCTRPSLEWVAEELGPNTRLNLMFQYRPAHRALSGEGPARRPTEEEKSRSERMALDAGLRNLV